MSEKHLREEIEEIHRAEQPVQKYWAQLTTLATVIFFAGVAWVRIDAIADDVQKNANTAKTNSDNAQSVAQKLVRIEGNQERFKSDVNKLDEKVEKLDEKLDKILEEIRKQ